MQMQRPDLSAVDPQVKAYIEALEAEVERTRSRRERATDRSEPEPEPTGPLEPDEPPTTVNILTLTAAGVGKRTYRHLYSRQHRGGMGVFGLDTSPEEPPAVLATANEGQGLLLFTSHARAFRLPLSTLPETPLHARGHSIWGRIMLASDEFLVAVLPDLVKGSVAMLSERGMVRILRHHVFGEYMKPGTLMFDLKSFGPLAAACWTPGDGELFIATRQGRGIRFSEKLVPPAGGAGIKLETGDRAVTIAPVNEESGVFLATADGRGTVRLMNGFNANKSTGGSGKIAMSTSQLVGALPVQAGDDIFMISRLGKVIRFQSEEVPPKEGVVQGVNCMSLRGDEVVAVTNGSI